MFSRIRLVIASSIALLVFAGCGGDDNNNSNNQSDAGDTADAGDTSGMDADTSETCTDFDVVIDSDINSDRTLTPDDGCLLVEGEVQIEANLTIEPGVTLYFGENAMFDVNGGSITAEGTASDPILLTSPTESAGDWRGIVFRETATADNAFSYVTLEYAGGDSIRAALNFQSRPDQPGNGPVEISLDNTTVRHSATRGIAVERATTFNSFTDNTFTENEGVPMWAEPVSLSAIDDTNTFTGNGEDIIEIAGMTIDNGNAYTWPSLDAPYRLLGSLEVDDSTHLTVEAGVQVKCAEDVYIDVQGGILTADGSSEAPIVFEGVESTPGHWAGIQYRSTENVDNILNHVTIQHAGGGGLTGGNTSAGLTINSRASQPGGNPVQISITDVTVRESADLGIYIERNATLEAFDANRFTANEGAPAWIDPRAAVQIGNSSSYTGNGDDVIRMYGLTINGLEGTWMAQDVPYRVEGQGIEIESSSHITIAAGTEIQFEENLFVEVQDAKLTAAGTTDNPILLTGTRDIDGIWYGVQYRGTVSVDNRLEHVTIRYAGGGVSSGSADPAALVLNSEQAQPGGDPVAITLDSVTFENVDSSAVYVEVDTTLNGCSNLAGVTAAGVSGNGATNFVSSCGL